MSTVSGLSCPAQRLLTHTCGFSHGVSLLFGLPPSPALYFPSVFVLFQEPYLLRVCPKQGGFSLVMFASGNVLG